NDDHAVQVVTLQLRPATARHLRHVGPVRPFPGPLDGGLPVPCARSPVHVALDVAELEVPGPVGLKLDERLDLLVEVVLVPPRHGDDVPQARERRLLLLLTHRHTPDLPGLLPLVTSAHGKLAFTAPTPAL